MAGRILMDRNQSNHNPLTSGSSSDDLCFSVNDKIWQKFCSILQEAYPNWMPWTELHHTYEQLYQEAFPQWAITQEVDPQCQLLKKWIWLWGQLQAMEHDSYW